MALVYHAQGAGAVGGPAHKHSTAQHIRPSLPARAPRPQPKVSASNPRPLKLSLRLSLALSKTLLHLWAPSFPTTTLQPYIPMPLPLNPIAHPLPVEVVLAPEVSNPLVLDSVLCAPCEGLGNLRPPVAQPAGGRAVRREGGGGTQAWILRVRVQDKSST